MNAKISALVKAAVSALLFYLLFRKMDFHQFGATLSHARLGILFGSFALLWIGHYICIFRWRMLMRPLMPVFSLTRLFEIYCIGLFFNLAFPTAVGGDVVKMYYAGKPSRQYAQSFAATFLDRDSGMLAMMIIACIGTILLPMRVPGIPVSLIIWLSFVAFVVLNFVIFTPRLHRLLTRVLHKVRLSRIATKVDAISNAFQIMGRNPRVLLDSLMISTLNQLLVFSVAWVTAIGLHIEVSFLYFLVLVPVITLVTMLPITLSGTGLREYAFVSLFGAIGVAPASGLALGLLGSIMVMLSAVPGGIVYIFFRNRSDLRQMAAMETDFS
ncbi:MAG: flippase-like domain-containing protein [Acidobacteriia bacterium]|nr:flippase-like domain-containing protein [Terriglobia bacterium]